LRSCINCKSRFWNTGCTSFWLWIQQNGKNCLLGVMGTSEVSGNLSVERWLNWLYLHVLLSAGSQMYSWCTIYYCERPLQKDASWVANLSLVDCDNLHCGIRRGIVTYQDFISTLDLPDCALLGQIFSYFDRSDQGSINFSQVHYPMRLLLNVSRLFDTVWRFSAPFLVGNADIFLTRCTELGWGCRTVCCRGCIHSQTQKVQRGYWGHL
jgi:hypothetical protein